MKETVWVLETNVDDCSGEQLGYVIERLMAAGALDACCFPMLMKKGRPAYMLQVICSRDEAEAMEDILFFETSSIGLRKYQEQRVILPRKMESVSLPWGEAKVKICTHKGQMFCYPEYEDVKALCQKAQKPYRKMYELVFAKACEIFGQEDGE